MTVATQIYYGIEYTGWNSADEVWTYASATTFTVPTDLTAKYHAGTKIKWTQTTVKYGVVVSSTYSAPDTTVTIEGLDLYTIANAPITLPCYSYAAAPQGFPARLFVRLTTAQRDAIASPVEGMVIYNLTTDALNVYAAGAWGAVGGGGGSAIWTAVPGTPVRIGNTSFSITDTGNANLYDKLISKGTCLKWTDTTTHQAMVVSAVYGANIVTITIIGDVLSATATMSTMKYAAEKARLALWAVAGTIGATGTNVAAAYYAPMDMKIFGADIWLGTAGSGTTTVDINDDGTTMFTTKPSITTTNTSDLDNTADDDVIALEDSKLTVDLDAVAATPGVDLYAILYWTPNFNQYLV